MPFEIIKSPQTQTWLAGLSERDRTSIVPVIEALAEFGPELNKSVARSIKTSRHPEMQELKSLAGNIRVLYAIDSKERAVLLVGGDKTGSWNGWYPGRVSEADHGFDAHKRSMGEEGTWRQGARIGARASGR